VVGAQIYAWVRYGGERRVGVEGSEILIHNQIEGLERAVRLGLTVKVNTVLIPGVNEAEIPRIAEQVKRRGAFVMNVMPLIPQAQFAHIEAPSRDRLEEVRRTSEQIIGQFRHCQQCRADAVGLIGGGCSTI
jgi:nitrogen fixation protein NifB